MTVTVTKPEINLREELSAVKSPTGVFGEQLGRAETATDFYNLTGSNKNLIINGDMRFSQRGDYSSGYTNVAATPVYTIDRFFNRPYGSGAQTITHNSVVLPDGTYTKSMKVQQTTTNDTPFYHMHQMLEIERWMLGKTFTVSYWYRTNTPRIRARYCDNISCFGNWGEDMIDDEQWHYNVWQMKIPTNATIGGGAQMHPAFTKASGANILNGEYFEFTLMQVELGTVATPFEFRSNQVELALCQRYYWQHSIAIWASAILDGTSDYPGAFIQHPVPMRITPTGSFISLANFYYNTGSGQTSFVPAGGTTNWVGNNIFGYMRKDAISNSPGGTHAMKVGFWNIQCAFNAEF
jgi:hypothetical protein